MWPATTSSWFGCGRGCTVISIQCAAYTLVCYTLAAAHTLLLSHVCDTRCAARTAWTRGTLHHSRSSCLVVCW
jgi:hypothetical protein